MQTHLANFVCKLFGFTVILAFVAAIVPSLYVTMRPIVWTVSCLAIVGTLADAIIVPRLGNLKSLMLGFPGMAAIVWGVAQAAGFAHISVPWAVVLALCIGPLEYVFHLAVLKQIQHA